MGFLEDFGQAVGNAVSSAANAGSTVVESVTDTAADVVEAVTDTAATIVEEGSDLLAGAVDGGASLIGSGLDTLFGDGSGDGIRQGGRALANGIRRTGRTVGSAIRAGGHRAASWIRQSGDWLAWGTRRLFGPSQLLATYDQWSPSSPITGISHPRAEGFNVSDVSSQYDYTDSGTYYEVMIDDRGRIHLRRPSRNEDWRLLIPSRATYDGAISGPVAISYHTRRGRADAEPKHEPDFDFTSAPVFEMVAVGENRLFAKEAGTDNFYIAAIVRDFLNYREQHSEEPIDVPGFYTKLDPEYAVSGARFEDLLLIEKYRYKKHISLANFLLYNISRRIDPLYPPNRPVLPLLGLLGVALLRGMEEVRPDMMLVRFDPGMWHRLDCRPPKGSGELPAWLVEDTYRHVDYGWDWGWAGKLLDRSERSICFRKVLGMGVGRLHRHTHYSDDQGGELHVLAFNMGPIGDFASFFDGTCNYYVLCQIKKGSFDEDRQDALQDAYGLLWIDEQTYYSERWRLVHPDDNKWGNISRSMVTFAGLPPTEDSNTGYEPYRDGDRYPSDCLLELERFWCPFRNGFIHSTSRLAVARQTCLVSGRVPPDFPSSNQDFSYDFEPGEHLLFSLVFSWGSIDRTWRWRKLPIGCQAVILSEEKEKALLTGNLSTTELVDGPGDVCYPQLIGLRDDMTITLRGAKTLGNQRQEGYWVQKYLPADNWEVPFVDEAADTEARNEQLNRFGTDQLPPTVGYNHDWHFVTKDIFDHIKRYSHWGHYGSVDSRSQYYEIFITSDSTVSAEELTATLTQDGDSVRWIDTENRLAVYYPWCNYSALEDILITGMPAEPLFEFLHQPPSFFNHSLSFKITSRPSWPTSGMDTTEGAKTKTAFIATHWDKRDDDLAGLQPLPPSDPISLLADPTSKSPLAGKVLTIRLGTRRVVWKTPVVQQATIAIEPDEKRIELSFTSTIQRRPRYLMHWKRIEDYMGIGVDMVAKFIREQLGLDPEHPLSFLDYDRWLQAEIPSDEPDLVPFEVDHDPEQVDPYADTGYPCPDTTIRRVFVEIIDEGSPRVLFDLPIDAFIEHRLDNQDEVEFLFSWSRQYTDAAEYEEISRFLVAPSIYTHATSVVFEDLVGHVATPESIKFVGTQTAPFVSRKVPD